MMKRCIIPVLFLCGLFLQPQFLHAQEAEEQQMQALPQWLIDFSNLPAETRNTYIGKFNLAKEAYQQDRWIDCIALLAECEIILRGNPNIWNLRACCLMEQQYFTEAEEEIKRVLEATPDDEVARMNLAYVYMARGLYKESLAITTRQREDLYLMHAEDELLYALDFRVLLCYLLMGQEDKAHAIATSVTPMTDTPLYHYAKAAIALVKGNPQAAAYNLNLAKVIFANNKAYIPYERALNLSGILKKKAPGQKSATP
ncbi:MAG: hypothetical protein IKY92_06620 [Akkermansia sp.]|nr:hypothetical protein [Akkermansia sp.]